MTKSRCFGFITVELGIRTYWQKFTTKLKFNELWCTIIRPCHSLIYDYYFSKLSYDNNSMNSIVWLPNVHSIVIDIWKRIRFSNTWRITASCKRRPPQLCRCRLLRLLLSLRHWCSCRVEREICRLRWVLFSDWLVNLFKHTSISVDFSLDAAVFAGICCKSAVIVGPFRSSESTGGRGGCDVYKQVTVAKSEIGNTAVKPFMHGFWKFKVNYTYCWDNPLHLLQINVIEANGTQSEELIRHFYFLACWIVVQHELVIRGSRIEKRQNVTAFLQRRGIRRRSSRCCPRSTCCSIATSSGCGRRRTSPSSCYPVQPREQYWPKKPVSCKPWKWRKWGQCQSFGNHKR